MAFCRNCGTELPADAAFCPNCGTRTGDAPAADNRAPYYDAPAGNNAPYYGNPAGGYRVDIQARNIVICIILSIVTCGIYGLIWFFGLVNDLNKAAPSPDDKTPGTVLLFSIVTCGIYSIIWLYKSGEKVDRIRTQNGEAPSSSALIYLLLSLFGLGIVAYAMIQNELNKVASIPAAN